MSSICIVGAGATGLLLLLLLHESGFDMSKVTIVDPYFDGGDLARKWTAVISNTPWSKSVNSLKQACPSISIPTREGPDTTTPLVEIAHLLRELSSTAVKNTQHVQGNVVSCKYDSTMRTWTTTVETGGAQQHSIQTSKLILTQGSEPKKMNLPIPAIPLEIALDIDRIKHYIRKGDKVLVFGTMHSGTLVIQNGASLGANVTAYYNTEKPFYWARDGIYDGIKADAAEIADKIVAGITPVTLVSTRDTAQVIRTSHGAQWAVFAMGFQPRPINITVDSESSSHTEYDGQTGRLGVPAAWGFGVAYPNRAPDGVHWDVSVASFLEHMKLQIPNILE
jgi:cation diffusion facilitator CzcD-associated flavoprotein CzcO